MNNDCVCMTDNSNLNTWVEVIDVKSLKEEIINDNPQLKNFDGLVLKRIHKSNIAITYEKMEGGLAGYLEKNLSKSSNLPNFIKEARLKFC